MLHRFRPRLAFATVVPATLIVGLCIAGCGGDGSTSSTGSTTAAAKAAFLKKGNAICQMANQRLKVANRKAFAAYIRSGKQAPAAKVRHYVTSTLVPEIERQLNQLRSLRAPPGDEETVKRILDTAQADVNKVKADPDLLVNNTPAFADADQLAKAYGLTACGSG